MIKNYSLLKRSMWLCLIMTWAFTPANAANNLPPTASTINTSTPEDKPKVITLKGVDPEKRKLTYSIISQPSHGSLTLKEKETKATYTPSANYFGTDSFTFKVNDGVTDSVPATVSINITSVNDKPVAQNGTASTSRNTAVDITLSATDIDLDSLIYTPAKKSKKGGTVVSKGNNLVTYTPPKNYAGEDSFTFTAKDSNKATSAAATIKIVVKTGASSRDTSAFPVGLAVAAPTDIESTSPNSAQNDAAKSMATSVSPASSSLLTQSIDALLSGVTPLKNLFTPELLYRTANDALCYGPALLYHNLPDGVTPNSGTLPPGDLGIWQETDILTGHACVAAQLNSRMQGIRDRSTAGLMVLASMIDRIYSKGGTLPTAGSSIDLTVDMNALSIPNITFNSMTLSRDTSSKWLYNVDFDYTRRSSTYNAKMQLTHNPSGSGSSYNGVIQYQIQDSLPGGNCMALPSGTNITRQGSVVYERISADQMRVEAREADFCGHGGMSGSYLADGRLDPADKLDAAANSDGWGNNFNQLAAEYKLSNLSGKYAYVWQAGPNDSHSRVFNMGVNDLTPLDGEAWFGYGTQIDNPTGLGTVGQITGFICNWAGPGSSHMEQEYAQRQFFHYNSTTGKVEVVAGGSDITYAPTNACTYDGSGTFQYDRNLDSTLDAADVAIVKTDTTSPSELEFDIFPSLSSTYYGMTMEDAIPARGYTLPNAPSSPLP